MALFTSQLKVQRKSSQAASGSKHSLDLDLIKLVRSINSMKGKLPILTMRRYPEEALIKMNTDDIKP